MTGHTNMQEVRRVEGWLFSGGDDSPVCIPGFLVVLSQFRPLTAGVEGFDWFMVVDESVDGMGCGTLNAFALNLNVTEDVLKSVLKQTDWSRGSEPDTGWRHDLSWHNTKLDGPNDPTVRSYLGAIAQLGLTWTVPTDLATRPYGIKLAQAAYPFDATDENLQKLGIADSIQRLLGEPANPAVHSIVLLTPNDD
jgi:hypothetical protein